MFSNSLLRQQISTVLGGETKNTDALLEINLVQFIVHSGAVIGSPEPPPIFGPPGSSSPAGFVRQN